MCLPNSSGFEKCETSLHEKDENSHGEDEKRIHIFIELIKVFSQIFQLFLQGFIRFWSHFSMKFEWNLGQHSNIYSIPVSERVGCSCTRGSIWVSTFSSSNCSQRRRRFYYGLDLYISLRNFETDSRHASVPTADMLTKTLILKVIISSSLLVFSTQQSFKNKFKSSQKSRDIYSEHTNSEGKSFVRWWDDRYHKQLLLSCDAVWSVYGYGKKCKILKYCKFWKKFGKNWQ